MTDGELGSPAFWILTSLAQGRLHGYGVLSAAQQLSGGQFTAKVTTVYAALERLEGEGLIRADGDEVVAGRLRRYFRITDEGVTRLGREVDRMAASVRVAREQIAARPRPATGGAA